MPVEVWKNHALAIVLPAFSKLTEGVGVPIVANHKAAPDYEFSEADLFILSKM